MPRPTKLTKAIPSHTIGGVDLYSTETAATMLRPPVTDRRMRALSAAIGVGTKIGRGIQLTLAEVERIQRERRPSAGRPPAGAKSR